MPCTTPFSSATAAASPGVAGLTRKPVVIRASLPRSGPPFQRFPTRSDRPPDRPRPFCGASASVTDAPPSRNDGHDGGMRIVSLLPSATEIAYALGLGDQLVGVTHE